MLLSQTEEGHPGNSRSKNVPVLLRICFGALCGLVLACSGPLAFAGPSPATPASPQAQTNHSIGVTWAYVQGTDLGTGFNVYRSVVSGGPYTKLTTSALPITTLTFSDTTGMGGTKYFYVVTAIDAGGVESVNSNETFAIFISSSPNAPANATATAH